MSKRRQTLKALVTERLTAAAEEIFALVEKTIAEYEEELGRKQQLLDKALQHTTASSAEGHSTFTETVPFKEEQPEQNISQLPPFPAVCVKIEMEGENPRREGPQADDSSNNDDNDDGEPPTSVSAARTETEGKLECPFCQRSFATKSSLKVHLKVHTGEKSYSCSVCEKTFTRGSSLQEHMRTHTGERPYSCSTCHKTFARRYHLKVHEGIHAGERPFSCSRCSKTFLRKDQLRVHMRKHTDKMSCS